MDCFSKVEARSPDAVSQPAAFFQDRTITDVIEQLSPELKDIVQREIESRVALRLEEEISHHRRLLDLAQEGGRVGVFEIDMRSGKSTGSAMWARLLGQPEVTACVDRQMWINMVHPDDRKRIVEAVAKAVAMGCDTALDYRIMLPDGSTRWLHSRNLIEKDEHGRSCRAYGTLQDITDRKLLEAQILHNANHDILTGLPNRRWFMEEVSQAFEERERTGQEIGLALFDLDDLKPANDHYGHEAGDALIQATANRLGEVASRAGMAARLGGDEFAILLKGHGALKLRKLAEQSLHVIHRPVAFSDLVLHSSASAGGAVVTVGQISSPELLLRRADLALYAAKRHARGTYQEAPRG
jgi:diguanylate cyclase (GGDEF)-like protein